MEITSIPTAWYIRSQKITPHTMQCSTLYDVYSSLHIMFYHVLSFTVKSPTSTSTSDKILSKASSFNRINMTKKWLEFDCKKFTPTNLNVGTSLKIHTDEH